MEEFSGNKQMFGIHGLVFMAGLCLERKVFFRNLSPFSQLSSKTHYPKHFHSPSGSLFSPQKLVTSANTMYLTSFLLTFTGHKNASP